MNITLIISLFLGLFLSNSPLEASESLEAMRKDAIQEDINAQYNLGVNFYEGKGVAQDFKEVAKWFAESAEKGLPSPSPIDLKRNNYLVWSLVTKLDGTLNGSVHRLF